ncbi:hypothetical protein EYB31_18320 [Paenibacillus thalictri]|uniref:Copper amine oxidase-like N-terminal domain-containing protein n=2 Tax=Paenibacillus thalictri TaxID=2527873 RepID=A0A4Q9DQ99_9BACL|nr:hypothetical protein EYB31_18320 [Paenibacillus thalictri]
MKMKKRILAPIATAALLLGQVGTAFADDAINVYLKGKQQTFEQPPIIKDGSTLVPMRAIFEALGAAVEWDGNKQIIDATKEGKSIRLQIGWKGAWIGQTEADLDVAPEIVNGSTMVPLRFVGEALGEKIEWDGDTRSVLISTDKSQLSKADSGTYKGYADVLKEVIAANTDTGLKMSDATYNVLASNADAFFSENRGKFSLESKAQKIGSSELSKNPVKYSSTITELNRIRLFDVKEVNLDNGQVVTIAFGENESGGLYFQVFYVGSTNYGKGDTIEMRGVPVGASAARFVNKQGNEFNAQTTVFAAGNLFAALDKYLDEASAKEAQRKAEEEQKLKEKVYDVKTGLKSAIFDKNTEAVKDLITKGADVNQTDDLGNTPLFYAVSSAKNDDDAYVQIVQTLLDAGANPNPRTNGLTLLNIAYKNGSTKIGNMLNAAAK